MSKQNNNTPPTWPEWHWRAQDEDGAWYVYQEQPNPFERDGLNKSGYWGKGGKCALLRWDDPNPNWKETLEKRVKDE